MNGNEGQVETLQEHYWITRPDRWIKRLSVLPSGRLLWHHGENTCGLGLMLACVLTFRALALQIKMGKRPAILFADQALQPTDR